MNNNRNTLYSSEKSECLKVHGFVPTEAMSRDHVTVRPAARERNETRLELISLSQFTELHYA